VKHASLTQSFNPELPSAAPGSALNYLVLPDWLTWARLHNLTSLTEAGIESAMNTLCSISGPDKRQKIRVKCLTGTIRCVCLATVAEAIGRSGQ